MNLHESSDIYLELIQVTATARGIPAIYVEKDYWVTQVLKRLSESQYREAVVFKGGTSLSKAHGVIERFSEDIDLAFRGGHTLGDAQRRKVMKGIEGAATLDLKYIEGHPQESKHGRFRKTAYTFPTRSDASKLGQVANILLIELNSFANPEPSETMPIVTLIHDFLVHADRADLICQHELEPFQISVLSMERTLCEKIMGLVRTGHEPNALGEFRRRIRHFYDIAMIMRAREYQEFVNSDVFVEMIAEVRKWGPTIDARHGRMVGSSVRGGTDRRGCGKSLESNTVRVSGKLQGHGVRRYSPGGRRDARVPCLDWRVIDQGLRER